MNIFLIPSWYPSNSNPLPGIFFRDQAFALAKQYSKFNIGISAWGQNDERLLLWAKNPLNNVSKLSNKPKPTSHALDENLAEYFSPAFTWTSKFMDGNMNKIIDANEVNMQQFETAFGKADIIHAHVGYPAGYIAKKLSNTHDIPYVITEHMSPFPHAQFLDNESNLDERLKASYRNATKIICVSHSLEQKLNSFGIANSTVIPNLVKDDFFTADLKSLSNKKFIFFSLARMVPQKGIDILLNAFARITEDAVLRIGGDGEFLEKYQKLAFDLGIEDKVEWLGELDKSSALSEYQNCDAFVLPSRHESMGVVFVEAMACGKPVIASICGGPEEFVNDDCGYLVEPEDENGLAVAMQKMMKNYHSFDALKIRRYAESRFSKRIICTQIKNVYEEVVASFRRK